MLPVILSRRGADGSPVHRRYECTITHRSIEELTVSGSCSIVCGMGITEAGSPSAEAQEDSRERVVRAVRAGMSQTVASRTFGVARGTVNKWSRMHEVDGARPPWSLEPVNGSAAARSRRSPIAAGTTLIALLEIDRRDRAALVCPHDRHARE